LVGNGQIYLGFLKYSKSWGEGFKVKLFSSIVWGEANEGGFFLSQFGGQRIFDLKFRFKYP
jgi:hypothetical protein